MKDQNPGVMRLVLRVLQGVLIGVGAVLPGISGGVLCVVFGIYKPVMELLSNPLRNFKTHVPKLLPVIVGMGVGFLGVAKILAFFLETYPDPSVCLFIGLIVGMLPSLFREAGEQGRPKGSWVSMGVAFVFILVLLISLNLFSVSIAPNFGWYLFCGFCLAPADAARAVHPVCGRPGQPELLGHCAGRHRRGYHGDLPGQGCRCAV